MSNYFRDNHGFKWILLVIDVFTRQCFVEPMKSKEKESHSQKGKENRHCHVGYTCGPHGNCAVTEVTGNCQNKNEPFLNLEGFFVNDFMMIDFLLSSLFLLFFLRSTPLSS